MFPSRRGVATLLLPVDSHKLLLLLLLLLMIMRRRRRWRKSHYKYKSWWPGTGGLTVLLDPSSSLCPHRVTPPLSMNISLSLLHLWLLHAISCMCTAALPQCRAGLQRLAQLLPLVEQPLPDADAGATLITAVEQLMLGVRRFAARDRYVHLRCITLRNADAHRCCTCSCEHACCMHMLIFVQINSPAICI